MGLVMKSAAIIEGKSIDVKNLKEREKYFSQDEMKVVEKLAANSKAIADYWLVVFQNFFKEGLSESDIDIAKAIVDVSTTVATDKTELTFSFKPNSWVSQTKITRRFMLEEGVASKV